MGTHKGGSAPSVREGQGRTDSALGVLNLGFTVPRNNQCVFRAREGVLRVLCVCPTTRRVEGGRQRTEGTCVWPLPWSSHQLVQEEQLVFQVTCAQPGPCPSHSLSENVRKPFIRRTEASCAGSTSHLTFSEPQLPDVQIGD